VRSGAPVSMPGMLDTILNLGVTDEVSAALGRESGRSGFGLDVQRRFLQMFGVTVMGLAGKRLTAPMEGARERAGLGIEDPVPPDILAEVVAELRRLLEDSAPGGMPPEPHDQLEAAVGAVFRSWSNRRAVAYRRHRGISGDLGTAVTVQMMVFGNLGRDSGTGVAFTRNPATGARELYGEYLLDAQGEDVVAGVRTPQPLERLAADLPRSHEELSNLARRLEAQNGDVQDIEFTIERGSLYLLQTRTAKRTPAAAVRCAVDLVEEGVIDRREALGRVTRRQLDQLLAPRFEPQAKTSAIGRGELLATGLPASPGAASGPIALDTASAQAQADSGPAPILVRLETSPDDMEGMLASSAIVTARGGTTSHAAVVAREIGKPCVVGCAGVDVDPEAGMLVVGGRPLSAGEELSVDGTTGEVFAGALPLTGGSVDDHPAVGKILRWASELGVELAD
jgi:pyruvate, orthophosphate dikinase